MIEDWYEEGRSEVITDIVGLMLDNDDLVDAAERIYGYLADIGLIDYDTEKDVFYEWFAGEEG